MFRMINPVRDYAWGSTTALAEHFGWPSSDEPRAEIWMGVHAAAPSQVALDAAGTQVMPLDALLAAHPEMLGTGDPADSAPDSAAGSAGDSLESGFPFLFKVLAADRPLSIQAHPTAARAQAGFDAEEVAGIAREDAARSYVDRHHKPELLVALDDFAALSGFRDGAEAAEDLAALARLLADERAAAAVGSLADQLAAGDHRGALEAVLRSRREDFVLAAERINRLVAAEAPEPPLDAAGRPGGLRPSSLDTLRRVGEAFPGDPGILVTLLLNRVDLRPGEALFLPAGNLHAYLHGLAVEIMASSDNVLRGGLTRKHIDVDELLEVTDCQRLPVPHCRPTSPAPGRFAYAPACREFALERIELPEAAPADESTAVSTAEAAGDAPGVAPDGAVPLPHRGPAVLLCTAGELVLERVAETDSAAIAPGDRPQRTPPRGVASLTLGPGESAFLPATATHRLRAEGAGRAFLATRGTDSRS